jgi:hypothetical protein
LASAGPPERFSADGHLHPAARGQESIAASSKDKGRVVRGLCCSGGGVFKPDERETRGSLAKCSHSVNTEAARCSEAYLPQLLIIDVPNHVFTASDARTIEPRDRYGGH